MEKKMNARLVSLNILTHELYGRNYRLFGEQTADVFRQSGFINVNVIKDLSERDRFVEFTRIN